MAGVYEILDLSGKLFQDGTELTGPVPPELGNLTNLTYLYLSNNELTGPVPQSFLALDMLISFWFQGNAGLCAPNTTEFVTWLQSIIGRGPFCSAVLFGAALTGPVARRAESVRWWLTVGVS